MDRSNVLDEQAARLLGVLERQPRAVPLSTDTLIAVSGVPRRLIYHVIKRVKGRLSDSGRQLCNLRGVGYWIASSEGDKLDEAIKSYKRGLSHLEVGNAAVGRVDPKKVTADEMEVYGIAVAMRAVSQSLAAGQSELVRRLSTMQTTRDRLLVASREAEAPDPEPVK